MITLLRTNSKHPDFIELVRHLDADLAERDGDEHAYYAQFNKIDMLNHAVLAFEGNIPLGCGAVKEFKEGTMEVKRMYTVPESRGKGIGTKILQELENWSSEMNYDRCVLETGKRQPEAIALYEKNGYEVIPNYGQYAGIENSVCFEKKLN